MTLGALVWLSASDVDVALRPLLGASVALRSAAAALSVPREVRFVFAAPESTHSALRAECDRFGLTELHATLEAVSLPDALKAALGAVGDCDVLLVLDGAQPLLPVDVARLLVDRAGPGVLAAGCTLVSGAVFRGGDALVDQVDGPLWQAALPLAARPAEWRTALAGTHADLVVRALESGLRVVPVALDADARPLRSPEDLGRAVEAFGRRAPEYPLLWPRSPGTPQGAVTAPPPAAHPNITLVDKPS